ncbi:Cytochrome c oxidase subunit 7C, mitochondrial, partial [Galemys pyrenaicus]
PAPFPVVPFRSLHPDLQGREKRTTYLGCRHFARVRSLRLLQSCRRAMLGQSIRRFTTSVVRRSHYEEGPGKNLPFSVENKWRLLLMMTVYFGSGFAAPFF